MKCADCRENEALDTRWERVKRWFMFHFFPVEVNNISSEKYTQGFADGFDYGKREVEPLNAEQLVDIYEPGGEVIVSAEYAKKN